MAEQIFKGDFTMEDVKRRHLQNGDKLQIVFEAPWEVESHRELLDGLGRHCALSIEVRPNPQADLEGIEE